MVMPLGSLLPFLKPCRPSLRSATAIPRPHPLRQHRLDDDASVVEGFAPRGLGVRECLLRRLAAIILLPFSLLGDVSTVVASGTMDSEWKGWCVLLMFSVLVRIGKDLQLCSRCRLVGY